ncbi:MAG: hypothetical protein ABR499_21210, partial [Gemmatimonadaceae bacterium]
MRLKATHRRCRTLALLCLVTPIPALARAQSGQAGHGQHDHGGAKAAPAPAKPTARSPAEKPERDQVVGAADASMGGHDHGDMNSRFHMEMTPTRSATREDSVKAERLLGELRDAIAKYRDTAVAVADGYKMFMANVKTQRIYHFT